MPHKRINAPLVTGLMLAVLAAPLSAQAAEERAEEPTDALTNALTDAGADPLSGVFTLGEIEVSGNAEDNKNTTVEKIMAEELRDFDRNTVGDAVSLLPGVSSTVTGARNEQTLSVRGFDIKHVPLFLDGIPIYVPYDGYPDLGRFTTFDLSEIVVSMGFTSVLYGPNTMGGAINLVSRRPEKLLEGNAGIGVSSGDAFTTYANAGTNRGSWYLQTGGSYVNSDYFPLADDFTAVKTEDGDHRNNSYHRDEKANVKLGFTPNSDDEYAFSYTYQHGDKGVPPYTGTDSSVTPRYWQWPYWDKQSYYFTSKTDLDGKAYVKTRAYHDIFKNSLWSYDDDTYTTITKKYAFRSWYDDYTNGASLELGTPLIPDNLVKLALHYKVDVHREHNEGDPIQEFRDQMLSAGLEDTVTFSKSFYAIAGVSYDTIETLDAQNLTASGTLEDFPMESTSGVNPQIGFFYLPTEKSTINASVSQKTRLPSIKDRYSYKLGTALPNPDLDPEQSINYEVGYENRHLKNFRWKGTLFFNDVSDYIQQVTVPDPDDASKTKYQNQNIGEVDLSGVELEVAGYLTNALEIGCNYTFTQAENHTDDTELINIPEHKLVPYLKYTFMERLSTLIDAEIYSDRFSSSNGKREADGFMTANIKFGYDFGNGLLAETGLKNLLDEDYELEEGYPEPGRTVFANLRYTF